MDRLLFRQVHLKNIIVTFEDTYLDYTYDYASSEKKILIVRDIKNIVASRLQKLRSANTPTEKSLFILLKKVFGKNGYHMQMSNQMRLLS